MNRHFRCRWMNGAGLLLLWCVSITACDNNGQGGKSLPTLTGSDIVRSRDEAVIRLGGEVYRRHCAGCHGPQAQGDPAWRHRSADGFYPPPPLDGSGHAWHHPTAVLKDVIRNGSPPGRGKMPAWRGKLDEGEITAVIAWFQSLWPDEVYAAWYDREQRQH